MRYVIALNLHIIKTINIHEERIRTHMLRRSGENRRKFNDSNYKGPERRSDKDRRSGIDRRKYASSNSPS